MRSAVCFVLTLTSLTPLATAAEDREIPLGIEAVTGYRSEYVQRGFKLANDFFDFQLETELALTNQWLLNLGGWFGTEVGSGDFDEAAGFIGIRHEKDDLILGVELTWRNYRHTLFDDGLDIAPYATWLLNDDVSVTGGLAYDTGASGLYAFAEGVWSKPVGSSAFIRATAGLSAVDGYYDRSGLNDLYTRLTYTYAINRSVAVTPFLETSLPLKSHGESFRLVGGLWFEVNF